MELTISNNENLSRWTSLQVGGEAQYFIAVRSEEQLEKAIEYADKNALDITVLGGGSNVLVSDEGIKGIVINIGIKGMVTKVVEHDVFLTVGAGEVLDEVVSYAVEEGYWGLENLSHIPGTVGASPVQNVGAYGVEIKDILHCVRVYNTQTNSYQTITSEACLFGYRDSLFKKDIGKKYIVTSVTFKLNTEVTPILSYKDLQNRFEGREPTLSEIRNAIIDIRAKKFPNWKVIGTAGSFFKNPVVTRAKFEELRLLYPELPGFSVSGDFMKIPLGWILDKVLDLKGVGTSKVGTYNEQALVLVNKGNATAEDFILFANEITQKVHDSIGVEIQWEVTKLGF